MKMRSQQPHLRQKHPHEQQGDEPRCMGARSKTGRSKITPNAEQGHIRAARDSNDEPMQSEMRLRCGDLLDEQLGNSFVGQSRCLFAGFKEALKGRRAAHNAQVVECAVFATRNSLKSQRVRNLKSPFATFVPYRRSCAPVQARRPVKITGLELPAALKSP